MKAFAGIAGKMPNKEFLANGRVDREQFDVAIWFRQARKSR